MKEKVSSKVINAAVRKSTVTENCSGNTLNTYQKRRGKLAKLITDGYLFLRQSFDPPEVNCCDSEICKVKRALNLLHYTEVLNSALTVIGACEYL